MKVTVSYISSKFDIITTLKKIEETSADAIHADLMDGIYVQSKNFEKNQLLTFFKNVQKPIDFHLMTVHPEEYLDILCSVNANIIFFHPEATTDALALIEKIQMRGKKAGIVINPTQDIKQFQSYFPIVDAVLLMSVTPGKGGQHFLRSSLVNYELIKEARKNYIFELYIDGGINEDTISFVGDADGIISGSYICKADNYEIPINVLRNGGML